ncbi:gluconate transporter, partial [Salmonella enterica]
AGPLRGYSITRHLQLCIPDASTEPDLGGCNIPSFGFSLSLILLPLVQEGLKTSAARYVPEGSTAYEWVE